MQTCWTVGYVIGQIPSNIILTRVKPSIWIPAMEVRFYVSREREILTSEVDMGCPDLLPRKGK